MIASLFLMLFGALVVKYAVPKIFSVLQNFLNDDVNNQFNKVRTEKQEKESPNVVQNLTSVHTDANASHPTTRIFSSNVGPRSTCRSNDEFTRKANIDKTCIPSYSNIVKKRLKNEEISVSTYPVRCEHKERPSLNSYTSGETGRQVLGENLAHWPVPLTSFVGVNEKIVEAKTEGDSKAKVPSPTGVSIDPGTASFWGAEGLSSTRTYSQVSDSFYKHNNHYLNFSDLYKFAIMTDRTAYEEYMDEIGLETSSENFEEKSVQLQESKRQIKIITGGTSKNKWMKRLIKGDENANLRDIERATGIWIKNDHFKETEDYLIIHPSCSDKECVAVYEMVRLLLAGKHFRRVANRHGVKRMFYRNEAMEAFEREDFSLASRMKRYKILHANVMEEANTRAMECFFMFHNKERPLCEIDLHDLRAYSNRQKKIPGEAWKKLSERMEDTGLRESSRWLEIIVGAGNHSENEQQIRPMVEETLIKIGHKYKIFRDALYQFDEVNKGSLIITFKEYLGPQPCYGHYYCPDCDRIWWSKYSWEGRPKMCFECGNFQALPQKLSEENPFPEDEEEDDYSDQLGANNDDSDEFGDEYDDEYDYFSPGPYYENGYDLTATDANTYDEGDDYDDYHYHADSYYADDDGEEGY